MQKHSVLACVIAFVICFAGSGCGSRHNAQTFQDTNASGGEMRSPAQNLFPHISEEHYLVVNGKTYRHIRGVDPFYIKISPLNSILFITGEVDQDSTFHFMNLQSKKETVISGGPETFGWTIGMSTAQGGVTYIEVRSTNIVELSEQRAGIRMTLALNVDSKTVEIK